MSLNESIIKIRVELQNSTINKSGKNKAMGFSYFELKDFLPRLNELMLGNGVNDIITIQDNTMILTLVKGDERETYQIPFHVYDTPLSPKNEWVQGKKVPVLDKHGMQVMQKTMQDIQYLGALNTYYKRYLYLNAFGITDGEVIDGLDNNTTPQKPVTTQPTQPVTEYKATIQGSRPTEQTYQVNGSAPQPGAQMGLPLPTRTCECGHVQVERISGAGNKYFNCELCKSWIN